MLCSLFPESLIRAILSSDWTWSAHSAIHAIEHSFALLCFVLFCFLNCETRIAVLIHCLFGSLLCVCLGTRGFTAQVIVLEEAAFMKSNLFKRVVVPALGVENTSIFAISTPDDEFNYFSELLELKRPDGTPLFYLIMVGLACRECMEAGRGHECIHKLSELPPWKTVGRIKMIAQIMQEDAATFMRENQGIIITNRKFIYNPQWILALSQRAPYIIKRIPSLVWIYIDPHGGGSMSDTAVSSMVYQEAKDIDEKLVNSVYQHVKKIRARPDCHDAVLMVGFECNMGFDRADRYAHLFMEDQSLQPLMMETFVSKDEKKRVRDNEGGSVTKYGLFTDEDRKKEGARALRTSLMVGALCYARPMVSENEAAVRSMNNNQMRLFREEIKEPADIVFGTFKSKFSGKGPGGKKDDVVMVIQQNLRWSSERRSDPEFIKLAQHNGWALV